MDREVANASIEPSVETISFLFDAGLKKISDQTAVSDSLDSKIGVLLGFVVVSVAEVFGFLLLAAADNTASSPRFTHLTLFLFLLSLAFVVAATISGMLGLGMRKFALGFRYDSMISKARHTPDQLKLMVLDDLLQSSARNSAVLDQKQKCATATLSFVVLAIVTQAILSIVLFMSLMPEGGCNVR